MLGFFACQSGAAHVYAVEHSDAILLAQQIAQTNGFADRITFLRQDIFKVQLPERVDVLLSELIGKGLLGQQQERIISHCRQHFLKRGEK